MMVFHWSLRDSKSSQVSRTLLSILAVLNNAVVWMVSTRPPISKSSSPFNNPFATVPKAPITIGIIVTYMSHSLPNSLARSRYIYFFSYSISFILRSAGTAKSMILQILFLLLLIIIRSGFLVEIRWSVCLSKSHRSFCVILYDSCWVVHIPFVSTVKFKLLGYLPVDHLPNPVESCLIYKERTITFQTFFGWVLLLIVHTWNSSPLRSNLSRLQCTCTVQTTSGRPHRSPLVWVCQWPSSQSLSPPQLSHNDSL